MANMIFLKTQDPWILDHVLLELYGFLFSGIFTLVCAMFSLMLLDISRSDPADSHSWHTLVFQYVTTKMLITVGWYFYKHLMKRTTRVAQQQDHLLLNSMIRPNIKTEHGLKYNFKDIKSREDFRRSHPLTTYVDYIPYMQRIEEYGEQNLLTRDPVLCLAVTSGTTGKNKVLPLTRTLRCRDAVKAAALMFYVMNSQSVMTMQRVLVLGYRPRVQKTPGGLVKAPVSYFIGRYLRHCLSPREVFTISDEQTALYVHAVLGLAEREVGRIEGFMATLVWSFWRTVEQNWPQMCDDIERGRISDTINMDLLVRQAVNGKHLALLNFHGYCQHLCLFV